MMKSSGVLEMDEQARYLSNLRKTVRSLGQQVEELRACKILVSRRKKLVRARR
jgi:4-hydroxyphenylpyruvate dioxygenase-like putative hemolysin